MNKLVGIVLLLLVVGGVSYKLMQSKTQESISSESVEVNETTNSVITIEGSPFKYVPNEVRVKKGVPTTMLFKNIEGMHDFVVDDLGIKTKTLKVGTEESVTFTAEKAGSYKFYCSVGNHKAMGMVGTIIVE